MDGDAGSKRYIQLTERGAARITDARRKYRKSIEEIVADRSTPSINTVKRAVARGAVFVDTVDRLWAYLQRCALEQGETLLDLDPGADYEFVDSAPSVAPSPQPKPQAAAASSRRGWLSRQVPHPNRLFTGRRTVLDRLHSALKSGAAAIVPDPQALTGLGGIGKTQAAIAYAHLHRRDYEGVFWVGAETIASLEDGLGGIADELGLQGAGAASSADLVRKAHDWFRENTGWLLVLDNVEDFPTQAPHFPPHHNGSLLITTRSRNTVKWAAPVEVEKFDGDEGALFLLRRAGVLGADQRLSDAPPPAARAARQLAQEVDGLPLALEQAGAYLSETGISPREYLDLYRAKGVALLDSMPDPDHLSVASTYTLALEQLSRRGPQGPAGADLVRLSAFLAPDAIPEIVFASCQCAEPSDCLCGQDHDAQVAASAAACGYSLLRRDPASRTLWVHRLVQSVVRDSMPEAERKDWMERAVRAVSRATPDWDYSDWPICERLLPHWRVCADYVRQAGVASSEAAHLLFQAGRYLRARARFVEAESTLTLGIAVAEQAHGPWHSETARHLDELGCLYRELDRLSEAQPLSEQALQIVETTLGPDHGETAAMLHNLALLYTQQRAYARAESAFRRALDIRDREASRDYFCTSAALTQLAYVYRMQHRLSEAEECYRRALSFSEEGLGRNHPHTGIACNNLALWCVDARRYEEAEGLYRRALDISVDARGTEHPETAAILWGLGLAIGPQGRVGDARAAMRRAGEIYTRLYGPNHSRTLALAESLTELDANYGKGQSSSSGADASGPKRGPR